jgi:hypothetical protein
LAKRRMLRSDLIAVWCHSKQWNSIEFSCLPEEASCVISKGFLVRYLHSVPYIRHSKNATLKLKPDRGAHALSVFAKALGFVV